MRPTILLATLLATVALVRAPATADACSIANDQADPPTNERAYDAAKAPGSPTFIDAHIQHDTNSDMGCMGMSSCGDIHGLSLEVDVAAGTELLRIDFQNTTRPTLYAHVWNSAGGQAYIFLPGFPDDDMLEMEVRALDADGYPSQPVSLIAYSDNYDDGGCQASGGQTSAGLLVLAGLLVAVRRRRSMR